MAIEELGAERLCRTCDPERWTFETTEELEDLPGTLGQPRAVAALRFGVGIEHEGYNLFAFGPQGIGKRTTVEAFLKERASQMAVPMDLVYVNNFEEAHRPVCLRLPAGRGRVLRSDMESMTRDLQGTIATALDGAEYKTQRGVIENTNKARHEEALAAIHQLATESGFLMMRTPMGMVFAPGRDGEVMSPEALEALGEEEGAALMGKREALEQAFKEFAEELPEWERSRQRRLRELARTVTAQAVSRLMAELRSKYADLEGCARFLGAVEQDIVNHSAEFVKSNEDGHAEEPVDNPQTNPLLRRYQVNLLIDHAEATHAPVVVEEHPSHANLVGRVEYLSRMGALVTDFLLIRPGALHRANGGFLVLEARHLLMQPYAWELLKRVLRSKEIRFESLSQTLSLSTTVSLEPETVPLRVKVVLLGDREIYYLLARLDPDFGELFKVAVDFDGIMAWTSEGEADYARMLATLIRREELLPLSPAAVSAMVLESAREAGHQGQLSTQFGRALDLLREASYFAAAAGESVVSRGSVERAVSERVFRLNRISERMQEQVVEGVMCIATEGAVVGQINGLSVLQVGELRFGKPSRITARVRPGRGQVVDIEREVELGGPLHSKGVMILSSFLHSRYATDVPVALSASLVFEQSYGGVDGDSASSAELYALLSAIANIPLRQDIAVTGSVNQHGQIQAIGGVNEKVEGFFDLCVARGLTGTQGALVPRTNARHLLLRRDVVEAVEAGRFHVWVADTVDDGIGLLTGEPVGERGQDGGYPEGTLNRRVEDRLRAVAEALARFGKESSKEAP